MSAMSCVPVRRGPEGETSWTLATSEAWCLYWSVEALEQWTVEEAAAVLAHEVGHVIRAHAARGRRLSAVPTLWNVAADAEINDDQLAQLSPDGCWRRGPSVVEEAKRLGVHPLSLVRAAAVQRWPYLSRAIAALVPIERPVALGPWPRNCPGPKECKCVRSILPRDCGAPNGLLAEKYYKALQLKKPISSHGGKRGQDASLSGVATPSKGDGAGSGSGGASPEPGGEGGSGGQSTPGAGGQLTPGTRGRSEGPEDPTAPSGVTSSASHEGQRSTSSTGDESHGGVGVDMNPASSGASADSSTGSFDARGDSAPVQHSGPGSPVSSPPRERCCAGGSACTGKPAPWERPEDAKQGRTEAEAEQIRKEVAKAVREAEKGKGPKGSKGRGYIPGGWLVWVDQWEEGQRASSAEANRWERRLRAYLGLELTRRRGEESPSYARPRWAPSIASGRLVPGGVNTSARVSIVLDTSGSMSSAGREVAGIVAAICRSVTGGGSEGVRVISVDTLVHGDARVTSARDVSRLGLYSGGGGTDLRPGITRACEPRRGWRADVIIVVTDGDGTWPEKPPRIPVIVALVGGRYRSYVPPWARIIEVNQEERR